MFGKLKTKILKILYGSADKQLLNSTMKDISEAINHRKIIVWGVNRRTEKIIHWYKDKIYGVVDTHYKKRKYCGINVISPKNLVFQRPNEFCFLLLEDYENAISYLRHNKQNIYFAPDEVEKQKGVLKYYRKIKKIAIAVKKCLKKLLNIGKKGFKIALNLPYTLLFDKLTSPQMRKAFQSLTYKVGGETVKKQTWRKFRKAAKNKNIILFGYSKLTEDFIFANRFEHRIKAIYNFTKYLNWRLYGYKVESLANFKYSRKEDIILVCHCDMPEVVAAVAFFKEHGITEYFSFTAMEAKRIRYVICKPAYLFKRWLNKVKASNGLIRNYILFPLQALLRLLHLPWAYRPYKELSDLRNKFKGKRCFIVATGPSLNIRDVERLKHEYTFGVNRIFQIFDKTDWRPTFYALCDPKAIAIYQNEHKKLNFDSFCTDLSFITDYSMKVVKQLNQSKVQYVPMCYLDHFCSGFGHHYRYSKNLIYGSYNAQTVVNYCINIAQYLGFSEIYLLGVDCNYSVTGCYADGTNNPSVNTIQLAALTNELMLEGYGFIKKKMDGLGIKVYNASRSGKLEIFPKVDFDMLFEGENKVYDYERMPDGSRNPLTVSVNMITYGHEGYIRKALDSILMQKTKFKYEINIGEDCSPDNTRNILLEYKEKYPDIIQLTLRDKNVGAMKNAYDLFMNAKGKYIAYLEGDDYWSDENKLQTQVDFLEEHQEYIGCCTNYDTIDENNEITNVFRYWDAQKTLYTLNDLGKRGMCSLNNSLVHRNIFLDRKKDYSIFLTEDTAGDRFTQFFLLCHADLFRFPEKTLCYRRLNAPQLGNAVSQISKNRHIFLMFYRVELKWKHMAKKQFDKKYVSKDSKRLLFEAVKALCKYPEKEAFKEYLNLFWKTPNKFKFIHVSMRALLYCIWKRSKQHYGIVQLHNTNDRRPNILKSSNFAQIRHETKDWRVLTLPGEKPKVSFSADGVMLDSSSGNVRYRQMIKAAEEYRNKWLAFSIKSHNSFNGRLRLFIMGANNIVIEHAEFTNPDANKIIYVSKKIPKNSTQVGVQIMTEGDGILVVEYAKLELGKKPTSFA